MTKDLLPYPDQAMFASLRALGEEPVIQFIWLYHRSVSQEGLLRFHHFLGKGLLGRRIEKSLLPFGRDHWIAAEEPPTSLSISDQILDSKFRHKWIDDQAAYFLDPETGPAWRLSSQSFRDGSTLVSLTISHCIADGSGSIMAICEAQSGLIRELGYSLSSTRFSWRTLLYDLKSFIRDLPAIFRAVGKFGILLPKPPPGQLKSVRPTTRSVKHLQLPVQTRSEAFVLPSITIATDLHHWDLRARHLGGNRFSLVVALTTFLAARLGRTSNGYVHMMIPVDIRSGPEDTGANRLNIAKLQLPLEMLTTDLKSFSRVIKKGLAGSKRRPDPIFKVIPLVPLMPKRLIAAVLDGSMNFSEELPVGCTYMGTLPANILGIDGSNADDIFARGVDRRHSMVEKHGLLTTLAGSVNQKFRITFIGFQPGGDNSRDAFHDLIRSVFQEFGIEGSLL